jgi:dicarboxylate transporter 10
MLELVMVRLCADGLKPEGERLHYRNAIHGLWRIARDEGFTRLGRGMGATVTRSVVMNATQLSWYVPSTLPISHPSRFRF